MSVAQNPIPIRRMRRSRMNAADILIYMIMLLFTLLILYPFYNAVLISFTPQVIYLREPFILFPKAINTASYQYVLNYRMIWSGLRVTLIVTAAGTLYNIFLTMTLGYALNHKFPGRRIFLALIMFTMYFSGGLLPTYLFINTIGLMNKVASMILPTGVSIYYLMVMRKFFRGIPIEMEESAKIDGANDIVIFARIVMPLVMPMVATFMIYYGVERWNEWYNGMLYIKAASKLPLQLVLRSIVSNVTQIISSETVVGMEVIPFPDGIKMAAVIITMLPVMLLYPFLQRFFISGLTAGAVKG